MSRVVQQSRDRLSLVEGNDEKLRPVHSRPVEKTAAAGVPEDDIVSCPLRRAKSGQIGFDR
jgi:hypothetical protein